MPCVCHNCEPHVETSEILVGGPRVSEGFLGNRWVSSFDYSHDANPGGICLSTILPCKKGEYLGSAFPVTCKVFFCKTDNWDIHQQQIVS